MSYNQTNKLIKLQTTSVENEIINIKALTLLGGYFTMKKIATATIATAGIATFAFAQNEADAAENNNGYNSNDPTSYSYSYTIDQQGDYTYNVNNTRRKNITYGATYCTSTQSYTTNNNTTGGGGPASNATSDRNIQVTTTSAPSSSSSSISNTSGSSNNLYTAGQCTYYVFDKVGGKSGSTWGNANNWCR